MTITLSRELLAELQVELETALERHRAALDNVIAWPDTAPDKWKLVRHYQNRVTMVRILLGKVGVHA